MELRSKLHDGGRDWGGDLRREQVRLGFQHLPTMQAASFAVALLLCYVVRNAVAPREILAWALMLLIIAVGRTVLCLRFAKIRESRFSGERWGSAYLILSAASGTTWGLASFIIFPSGRLELICLFLLVTVSHAAATTVSHSSIRYAPAAWAGPALILYAARAGMEGGETGCTLSVMIVIYLLTILRYSLTHNAAIASAIRFKFENVELLAELQETTASLARDLLEHKKAEETSQKFRLLAEHSRDIILFMSYEGGHILEANAAAVNAYGYTREELQTLTIHHLRAPATRCRTAAQMEEAVSRGILFTTLHQRRDRSTFPVEVSSRGATIGNAQVLVSVIRDITERRQAEEALRASEDRFRAFMDNSPAAAWMKDDQGRYAYLSKTYENRFGISFEDWSGKTDFDVWPAEIAEQYRKNDAAVLASNQAIEVIEEVVSSDGSLSHWLIYKFPLREPAGKRYVGGIGVDITERRQAERALRVSEETLRAVIDGINESAVLMDTKGTCLAVNTTMADRLGKTVDEMLGSCMHDLMPVEVAEIRKAKVEECIRTGRPVHFEDARAGSRFDNTVSPVVDSEGRITRLAILGVDITERVRIEESLRESQQLLSIRNRISDVLLVTPDERMYSEVLKVVLDITESELGIFAYQDENGDCVMQSMSEELLERCTLPEKTLRLPPGTWGDSLWGRAIHEKRSLLSNQPGRVREGPFPMQRAMVVPIVHRGEVLGHWMVANKPTDYESKDLEFLERIAADMAPVFFARLQRDFEERRRRRFQAELHRSQQMLRLVIDNIPQRVFWKDRDSVYLGCNLPFAQDARLSDPNDIVGKDDYALFWKENAELYRQDDRFVMAADRPRLRYDEPQIRKDGSQAWLQTSKIPLHDEEGTVVGVLGTYEDITDRKLAEEERLEYEQRLHRAQKAESLYRMAGAIAHHFNNMLGAVMGNLELALLCDTNVPDATKASISEAMKASRRAAEISRLMLAYLGQIGEEKRRLDLAETCEKALPLLRPSLPDNVRLGVDMPHPGPVVLGDEALITQILTNLLSNAAEAMGDDGGEISITIRTKNPEEIRSARFFPPEWEPKAPCYACLSVSDTGCGLDPALVEKIFDPFFTTHFTGRGLGLPVALGAARAHDGGISVENNPGGGATFQLCIPQLQEPAVSGKDAPPPSHTRIGKAGMVLLVEDEAVVRVLAVAMLKYLGFEVIVAESGEQALEVFSSRADEISVLLLDLNLPGMSGWDTARALRALRPNIPVVIASGYDETQATELDGSQAAHAYLHKPYQLGDLKKALHGILQPSQGTGP